MIENNFVITLFFLIWGIAIFLMIDDRLTKIGNAIIDAANLMVKK